MDIWIMESVVSIVKHIHIDKKCVLTPVLLGMRPSRRAILYLCILLDGLPRTHPGGALSHAAARPSRHGA